LEGLRGKVSVSELCNRHQISQAQYYQWRDRLLAQGSKVFESGNSDKDRERLERKIHRLEQTVGQLHMDLKKSDEEWM
jgi:transposase